MKRIAINTLLAFATIEVVGLFLGSIAFASTEPLIANSPAQVISFIPFGFAVGSVITAIPTAIYSLILALLFAYAPRWILRTPVIIFVSTAMTTGFFLAGLVIMKEPISGFAVLILPSIAAGIAGTILMKKRNSGQQSGPAYPPQGVGSADP